MPVASSDMARPPRQDGRRRVSAHPALPPALTAAPVAFLALALAPLPLDAGALPRLASWALAATTALRRGRHLRPSGHRQPDVALLMTMAAFSRPRAAARDL